MDHQSFENKHDFSPKFLSSKTNFIAIYTVLRVMNKIKTQMGLEAMLEYFESYCRNLEKHNPHLETAVSQAISLMSMERVYREMVRG